MNDDIGRAQLLAIQGQYEFALLLADTVKSLARRMGDLLARYSHLDVGRL